MRDEGIEGVPRQHYPPPSPEKKGIEQATSVVAATYRLRPTTRIGQRGAARSPLKRPSSASSAMWNIGWENTW
jgi:hypothetical protein